VGSLVSTAPATRLRHFYNTPDIGVAILHLQFMAVFRKIMAWKLGDCDVRMALSKQIRCIIREKESYGFHVNEQ
jgi:hypothetical protein